jgi:hypothetical protein
MPQHETMDLEKIRRQVAELGNGISDMQDVFIDRFLKYGQEHLEDFDPETQALLRQMMSDMYPLIVEHGRSLMILKEATSDQEYLQALDALGLDTIAAQDAIDKVKQVIAMGNIEE